MKLAQLSLIVLRQYLLHNYMNRNKIVSLIHPFCVRANAPANKGKPGISDEKTLKDFPKFSLSTTAWGSLSSPYDSRFRSAGPYARLQTG